MLLKFVNIDVNIDEEQVIKEEEKKWFLEENSHFPRVYWVVACSLRCFTHGHNDITFVSSSTFYFLTIIIVIKIKKYRDSDTCRRISLWKIMIRNANIMQVYVMLV